MVEHTDYIMKCNGLGKKYSSGGFASRRIEFTAVDGVSLQVARGETLALVGESGCGKSTTGRLLLGLEPPSAGTVVFSDTDLGTLNREELRRLRRRMQMIFQDPYGSLNPRYTAGRTLAEPLKIHLGLSGSELKDRIEELLTAVGLEPSHAKRYPHEFSGGQRQRIAIARAISVEPEFVVADEPVSALDVSIQGQILRLLIRLRKSLGMAMLFISHDLAVVRQISGRVAVMYSGRIVELAPVEKIFNQPMHPYTRLLLDSVLQPVPSKRFSGGIYEQTSSQSGIMHKETGCSYYGRCGIRFSGCMEQIPDLIEIDQGHFVACPEAEDHFSKQIS